MPPWGGQMLCTTIGCISSQSIICASHTLVITSDLTLVSKIPTNVLGGPLIKNLVKCMPLSSVIDIHFK